MAKFTSIDEYIGAAPQAGQVQLGQLYSILKNVAPDATETIKWGTPFFVEPRFLFAFSAHKKHLGFTASPAGLEPFRDELKGYETTKAGILKIPYTEPLPENLIRRIAELRIRVVAEREDNSFW